MWAGRFEYRSPSSVRCGAGPVRALKSRYNLLLGITGNLLIKSDFKLIQLHCLQQSGRFTGLRFLCNYNCFLWSLRPGLKVNVRISSTFTLQSASPQMFSTTAMRQRGCFSIHGHLFLIMLYLSIIMVLYHAISKYIFCIIQFLNVESSLSLCMLTILCISHVSVSTQVVG